MALCLAGDNGVGSRVWGQTAKEGCKNMSNSGRANNNTPHTGRGDGVRVASREASSMGTSQRCSSGGSTGPWGLDCIPRTPNGVGVGTSVRSDDIEWTMKVGVSNDAEGSESAGDSWAQSVWLTVTLNA